MDASVKAAGEDALEAASDLTVGLALGGAPSLEVPAFRMAATWSGLW